MNHLQQKDNNMLVYSPALQQDPETTNWAFFKSLEHGQLQNFTEEITLNKQSQTDQKQTINIIERLNGIIDTEEPKFDKTKRESFEKMEKSLENVCEDMFKKVNSFYECQNAFSESIQHSIVKRREENAPELDDSERPEYIQTLASKPWIFQTLPGTTSVTNVESLAALNEKLAQQEPLSLWSEPLEIANGGPEFFAKIKADLLTKKIANEDTSILQSEQITALFGTAVLSGNQDLLLDVLDTLTSLSKESPEQADLAFQKSKSKLIAYVDQMKKFCESQPYQHAFLKQNISRVFGIGSLFPTQGLSERNTSITCDGSYVYLAIGIPKRAQLYKIGTGQNGTIAGKVYLQTALDREGEVTWVFCQGKLYLRRSSDEFGTLQIYDPLTFTKTGTAKLFLADMPQLLESTLEQANRNYPLLVDPEDNNLCIVTVQTVKRERNVKVELQAQFDKLIAKKAEDQKLRSQAPMPESEEEIRKLPKSEQLKRQKERIKKKVDAPGPPFGDHPPHINLQDQSSYQVLAFEMHTFDLSGNYKGEQKDLSASDPFSIIKDNELMKDALVSEMYFAFSGLFKLSDCARALKYNKNDIEAAANWLVAEQEQPDTNIQFRRISTTLLAESQMNSRMPGDLETAVRPGSLLMLNSITGGRWTLNQGKLSYHQTTLSDSSSVHTFSTDPNKKHDLAKPSSATIVLSSENELEARPYQTKTQSILLQMQMHNGGVPQYYWDGNQWSIMSGGQVAATIESCRSAGKEPPEFLGEDQLYEQIVLSGTHESSLQRQRVIEPNFQTYITYCREDSRFYSFPLGNSQRIVQSAVDFSNIQPVKEFEMLASDLDTFVLEVFKFLNRTEAYKGRLPWRWSSWTHTYKTTVNQQMLFGHVPIPSSFLIHSDTQQPLKLGEETSNKNKLKKLKKRLELVENLELQKILNEHKLTTSQEQPKPQTKQQKQKPPQKLAQQAFSKDMQPQPVQYPSLSQFSPWAHPDRDLREYRGDPGQQREPPNPFREDPRELRDPRDMFRADHRDQREPREPGDWRKIPEAEMSIKSQVFNPIPGGQAHYKEVKELYEQQAKLLQRQQQQQNYLPPSFQPPHSGQFKPNNQGSMPTNNQKQAVYIQESFVLPKELICVPVELSKHYAYCQTGSKSALQSLLSVFSKNKQLEVLHALLIWSTNASYLSVYESLDLVEQLYKLCLSILNENLSIEDPKTATTVRILITGWWLFATDAQKQLEVLLALLKVPTSSSQQQGQLALVPHLLDPESQMSPIQLLSTRFCQLASFYDLEILNVRKVFPSVLLVKKESSQQQVTLQQQQPVQDQQKEDDLPQKALVSLQPRCLKYSKQADFFTLFPKSNISISDVPFEWIQLRKISTKQRRNHNPLEISCSFLSNPINQAFFAVPVASCLTQDLVESIEDPKQVKLENILSLYVTNTETLKDLTSSEQQFQHLQSIRQSVKTSQQSLIQVFKQRISQGCYFSTELFAYLLGSALDWTDFDNPNQTQLLSEAIEIAVQYPRPQLLYQIQIALSRVLGKHSEAFIAYNCLPKLHTLISGFAKTPLVLEKEFSEGLDISSQKVWETAHPYAKQDDRKTHQMKVQGAIGYTIEFDLRCSTESPGDVLLLRSCEYNYQVNENIGTEFKFERRPHPGQVIVLLGEQLQIEFRHLNPRARNARHARGGRGGGPQSPAQSREDIMKRWGYKLTIKPIFGLSKFGESNLSQAYIQNSIVQTTNLLALTLTEAKFVQYDDLLKEDYLATESMTVIKKTLSWHLFKGGLKINELENHTNAEVIIAQGISDITKYSENYQKVVEDFLRSGKTELTAYLENQISQVTQKQSSQTVQFAPEDKVWQNEVKQLMECPEQLRDIVKKMRMQVPYPLPIQQQMMKRSFSQHKEKWDNVEQILIVAMLYHSGSMPDAQKFSDLTKEIISRGQSADLDEATVHLLEEFQLIGRHINIVLNWMLARLQGQSEFQMIIEDTLNLAQNMITERLEQKYKEEEAIKKQQQERELMAQAEKETRVFQAEVDSKLKIDPALAKSQLTQPAAATKQAVVTKIKQKPSKKRTNIIKLTESVSKLSKKKSKSKEESKQEESPVSQTETVKPVEEKTAEIPKYCELSQNELASLKTKILTKAHQDFIDNYQIDGDLSKLLNICMFFDIDLNVSDIQDSLKQVFKRVKLRIKSILDLDSTQDHKVPTTIDIKELKLGSAAEEVALDVLNRIMLLLEVRPSINYQSEVTRISSNKTKMQTILEQDEDIQSQLSGHQQSLVSQPDSDSEDMLDDLAPLQPIRSMSLPTGIQNGIARLAATSQPPAVSRARKQSAEYAVFIDSYRKWRIWSKRNQDEDDDLLSPNGSPLHGIVAFAKMSKIFDPEVLRSRMKDHVYRAAFRLVGLQHQERLFALLQDGPFVRFMWGSKAFSLHKSVLNDIETCGESMTRQLNAVSRLIVQQLMQQVVSQLKLIGHKFTFAQSLKQRKINGKTIEHQINSSSMQPIGVIDQKRLLLTLNDIRIMLSNIYTKEYVLESLRVDKKISSRNTLGVDQIQVFLRAVVNILVKSQAVQVGLNVWISQVSKLVLDSFIHQSETVKTETQRILLEMLLDTVVTQLQAADSNDKMQLLQLLSEVIRISIRSDSETSILQPGSVKVANCVKLLTKFICNPSEVPAVVRQAIRCAKLLLKQLNTHGQVSDLGLCKEFLKSLGHKILSYKPQESKKNEDQESTQLQPEQKSEQIDTTGQQASEVAKQSVEQVPQEYFVFAHLNIPHEEDFTFLITALFQWELQNPIYASSLHKSAADIVKKVAPPKPAASITSEPLPPIQNSQQPSIEAVEQMIVQQIINQELQQEDRKEEQHEGEKDWQTDSSNSGDEKLEPADALNEIMQAEKLLKESKESNESRDVDQIAAKMHNIMERMKQEQKLMEEPDQMDQFARIHQEELGKLFLDGSQENEKEEQAMKLMAEMEAAQIMKEQQMAQRRGGPRPGGAPPSRYGGQSGGLKLTYVQLAIEEIAKSWKAPLSTDSEEIQEQKLNEINFIKQLQLVVKEGLEYANQFFHQRNSLVLAKRPMSLEKSIEFANILKLAYIGKLDPIPLNPYSKTEDTAKKISCVNMTQAELFPLLAKKVQELGKADTQKSPVQPVQISVAPKRFKVTIIEKTQAAVLEKEMASKLSEIKSSQKSQRMGPIVHSKTKKQKVGFSVSIIIGELILFLRSLSSSVLGQIFNSCLKAYLNDTVSQNLLYGILGAFGGWNNQIATGTVVEVNTNELWCRGTIVESGTGKRHAIVTLDDDVFTLQKIPHSQIRVYSGEITFSPDQKLLSLCVIKAENDAFLLSMLLRACSKVQWSLDENDSDYKKFLQTLINVSKSGDHFEEDKSKQEYESALTLTWERLIDINEQKSQLMLTPKDLDSTEEQVVQTEAAKIQGIQNNEYAQIRNSYLTGLPEATVQQGKSEANLKLLYYWEKNIIPQILNFCQGTYRPYEFEYYFEQVRYHLRRGDSGSAINDAMTMLEHKIPPGMIIPDENQDWTSKILEECIVGNWLLAKIKQKNSGSETDSSMSKVFLQKLYNLGVEEILVQIKAVDGRSNAVLAEYFGLDYMQSHYLWIPITNLKSLYSPLPNQSLAPVQQLNIQLGKNLQRISSIYCRETLTNFVEKQRKIPSPDLKIEELISWSIWQNFSKDALVGWMKQFSSVLPIVDVSQTETQVTDIKGVSLTRILNKQIDSITKENNTILNETKAQDTTNMLSVLSEMMEESENQRNLIDWCATIWYSMANSVGQNRCVVDICNEYEKFSKLNPKNMLIPLHELLPNFGDQSVGTLLMFKKNGVKLAPCSKVQFFSDSEMVNLIHELNAGSEIKKEVPPIVLQYSHIWVYHDAGTNALLSKEEQHRQLGDNVSSSLQTAIISIPKEWQIACWLTETLSTSVINNQTLTYDAAIEVFQKLISSLVVFYEDSKAPNVIKSVVLKLLSRLLIKLRYLIKRQGKEAPATLSHFERMFIPKDFVRNLFSELMIQMEGQDCLHCAFVQDSVEFIMSFVIPVDNVQLKNHTQILGDIQVPQWITQILHLSYFLHYLRGEMDHLPEDTLQISIQNDPLENLILIPIKDLPTNYNVDWLQEQIKSLILSHQGRILNTKTDFIVWKDHIVILLDGWHPLKPLEVKEAVDSDLEEEKQEEVKPAAIKELKPTVFSCQICTFENPLAAPACDMCQSPRPPMDVIMEEFRKANAPPEEPKPVNAASAKVQTSLNQQRVAALAADIKKIISKDQKQKLLHKDSDNNQAQEDSKVEEQEEDHKSDQSEDDEPEIDLSNLPGDPEERFRVLGIDASLLESGDQDLIMAIEMSSISDIQAKQQLKKDQRAEKLAARLLEKKMHEKELERQKIQASGGSIFKLSVLVGNEIFVQQQISQLAQEFLQERIRDPEAESFQLSAKAKAVIAKIHQNWKLFSDLTLPSDEPLLEDFEITAETMRTVDAETMNEMFLNLALADVKLFYKVIQSQGYDLWLTQAALPCRPVAQQMKLVKNVTLLEKVKRLIEQDICQEQKLVTTLEQHQLRLVYLLGPEFQQGQSLGYYDESQISHLYPELCESVSQAELRYMWSLLKKFNEYYAPVVPFVNQSDTKSQSNDASILPMTMAAYMSQTRDLCFKCVKTDLRHLILERTTQPRDQAAKLYFERLKLAEGAAEGLFDNGDAKTKKKEKQGENMFMFVQAHNQIKEMDIGLLRPKKPQGAEPHIAFEIIFKNEHVVGEGGPYRQFFADVSKELQPSRLERGTQQQLLDLLAPCANQRESEKLGKDRFVVQSQSVGQVQLSQYEFLGILMGVCIRTGANLILDLPQFFWKQLVGQKITLDDLYEIEIKLVNNLKQMLAQTEEEFDSHEHFWTTTLSDGFQIDLKPKGSTLKVKYSETFEFVSETILARLRESQQQYNAIKRGIAKVIPPSLFNIVTAKELEIWVCGRNSVDIDLLRRHTKYQGGSDAYSEQHPVIKNFWQFLSTLREDERQKFIKFCWGQERLPANDEAFVNQNVRFMIKPAPKQDKRRQNLDQDQLLPKADTCFFNFELPAYSSLEVMRAKIIQAITLDCVSMNAEEDQQNRDQGADMNPRGGRGMNDDDHREGLFEDDY